MLIKMIIYFNLMISNKTITECYTLPEENNRHTYCYTETASEYITDYLSEVTLVNYYKIKDNK